MSEKTQLYKAKKSITGSYGSKNEDSEPFEIASKGTADKLLKRGLIEEVKSTTAKKDEKAAASRTTKEEKATPKKKATISTKDMDDSPRGGASKTESESESKNK